MYMNICTCTHVHVDTTDCLKASSQYDDSAAFRLVSSPIVISSISELLAFQRKPMTKRNARIGRSSNPPSGCQCLTNQAAPLFRACAKTTVTHGKRRNETLPYRLNVNPA